MTGPLWKADYPPDLEELAAAVAATMEQCYHDGDSIAHAGERLQAVVDGYTGPVVKPTTLLGALIDLCDRISDVATMARATGARTGDHRAAQIYDDALGALHKVIQKASPTIVAIMDGAAE